MTDLSLTIAPKSDQLNSDDLIAGPMTIAITKVSACPDSAEQPIAIFFDGDNGKPYKPCKSMRRVLVQIWGKDGTQYPGRTMTLYRDAKVQFGGLAVGGIRISHMSDMDSEVTMALTATRANRKPFTVKPMPRVRPQPTATAPIGDDLPDHSSGHDEPKARTWPDLLHDIRERAATPANESEFTAFETSDPDIKAIRTNGGPKVKAALGTILSAAFAKIAEPLPIDTALGMEAPPHAA